MNSNIYFLCFSLMSLVSEGISYSGYQNEFFKQIDKQEYIYPRIISRKHVRSRFKRSNFKLEKNDNSIYVAFKDWIIKTNLNSNLIIPPHFKTQWASSGDHNKFDHHDNVGIDKCFPLEGEIIGVENSQISLTICDNYYYGLLIVKKKYFFLQPSSTNGSHVFYETQIPGSLIAMMDKYNVNFRKKSDQKDKNNFNDKVKSNGLNTKGTNQCNGWEITKEGAKYIQLDPKLCPGNYPKKDYSELKSESKRLRRHLKQFNYLRNDSLSQQPYRVFKTCGNYRRRKRVLTICDANEQFDLSEDVGVPENFPNPEVASSRFFDDDDVDYSNPKTYDNESDNRIMRDSDLKKITGPKVKWIKIVIGVDYDVIEFHGALTQQYIFTVFNIVSTLYKKISALYTMNIVILKILMYPNSQDSAIRGEDEKYPLYGANKWSRELKDKFSMAMWYTHFPLSVHAKTCYNSKMCDQQWSCIVVKDDGWISSIKIAHAIGHLIGLTHDGDLDYNNTCAAEAILEGTIMGKSLPDVIPVPMWSKCSGREFHTYIDNYRCLARPPTSHEVAGYLTGIFTLDEQCRIEFGDSFVFCLAVTITDPCRELWCSRSASRKRICTTRKTPTLEGTPCGRGKKCLNSVCTDPYRNITEDASSHNLHDQISSTPSAILTSSLNWTTIMPIIPSIPILNETQTIPLPPLSAVWSSSTLSPSWTTPILPSYTPSWAPTDSTLNPPTNWTMSPAVSPNPNWTLPVPSQLPTQPVQDWGQHQPPYPPPSAENGQLDTLSNWSQPTDLPNGFPNGLPNGFPNGSPNGFPNGQNGFPNGMPNGSNGISSGSPTGPNSISNGSPNGPNGISSSSPNGPNGFPNGPSNGPNGFPNGPSNGPNGFPNSPSNGPNGFPNSPSNGPNGISNGSPNGYPNGLNGFPNGIPSGQNGFPNGIPSGPNGISSSSPNGPNGFPNGIPSGPNGISSSLPNGYPNGPNGFPNGVPSGPNGISSSSPTGPNGFPNGPNGFPNGFPNGSPNGFPNGLLNGFPNGSPNGFPNGQNGFPNGSPNGYPNGPNGSPTNFPNGQNSNPNGSPNGFPNGSPNGPSGNPNGSPNGFPNGPNGNLNGSPNGFLNGPNGNPNGLPNRSPNSIPSGLSNSSDLPVLSNAQPSGARPSWMPPYYGPPSAQTSWYSPATPIRNEPLDSSSFPLPRSLDNSRSLTRSFVWYSSKPQTSTAFRLYNQSTFNSRNYSPEQLASSNQRSRNNSALNLLENQFYSSSNHPMLRNLSEDLLTYRSLDNSSVHPYDHLQNNTMNHLLNNTLDTSKLRSPSGPFFN